MRKILKYNIFFVLALFISFNVLAEEKENISTNAVVDIEEYNDFMKSLKKEMIKKGISKKTVKTVLSKYNTPTTKVIDLDRKQPEFAMDADTYLSRIITSKRVADGKTLYHKHYNILTKIQKEFGVQPQYILAFWGAETNFGNNFGGFKVVGALVTLSFDKRRSDFFKKQLYYALKIIDDGHITDEEMIGSWAGAMGNFQFMPSTFNAYAVDYDKDGKIDIWNSLPDAFASAANYLSSIGWNGNARWGREVRLPWNFDFELTGLKNKHSLTFWRSLNVKTKDGKKLPKDDNMQATIITPNGYKGKAYIIYSNFDKIMNWNKSILYALAIGNLADTIISRESDGYKKSMNSRRLSTKDIKYVQEKLTKLGFGELEADGKLGSKTIEVIKKFQKEVMLPADGYPNPILMSRLEKYKAESKFYVPVPKKRPNNN